MTSRTVKPWEKPSPTKAGGHVKLSESQIEEARARAEAAGRRYPNLVDNMFVAAQARKRGSGAKR